MIIDVDYAVTRDCPTKAQFVSWINTTLTRANQRFGDIAIRIVERNEIQQLNRDFRHQDKPTNVLSFPFDMPVGITLDLILGDLAICADVVEREAAEQHKSAVSHWAHMTVHGTLHLLGYDHITDHQAADMEALEIAILAQLNFNNPYH